MSKHFDEYVARCLGLNDEEVPSSNGEGEVVKCCVMQDGGR